MSSVDSSNPKCAHCGREDVKLHACTRCLSRTSSSSQHSVARYCDRQCQSEDWTAHKSVCRYPDYVVRIRAMNFGLHPVERVLCCPSQTTFRQFHQAIQVAFGWSDYRLHAFHIWNPSLAPLSWDEMAMSALNTRQLQNEHLLYIHEKNQPNNYFDERGREYWNYDYNNPPLETNETGKVRLSHVFESASYNPQGNLNIIYTYNFKDPVIHVIRPEITQREETFSDCFQVLSGTGPDVLWFEAVKRRMPDPTMIQTEVGRQGEVDFNAPGGVNERLRQVGLNYWIVSRGEGRNFLEDVIHSLAQRGRPDA